MTFRTIAGSSRAGAWYVAALVTCAGMASACSSDDAGGAAATGSRAAPPVRPEAPQTASTEEHNFALHKLFLGNTDRAGTASPDAWKKFGYDLDGKTTTSIHDTAVCKPKDSTVVDGENGIDNAFGA